MSITTGTFPGVRIADMPDLGAVTDGSSFVGERAGSGRFAAPAVKTYMAAGLVTDDEFALAVQSVENVAALRALGSGATTVYTQGYHTARDGGGGVYNLGPVAADNGGTIIVSANGTYHLDTHDAPVSVSQFGAKGDGVTDDTAEIQAALTASRNVYVPTGTYLLSATLTGQPNLNLFGDGPELSIFYRTANYGDTLVVGDATTGSAGGAMIEKIWFKHGDFYMSGMTTLPNLATSGAHVRLYGAQDIRIKDCYFLRLPTGVFLHGGSIFDIRDNAFWAVWDPKNVGCQEGLANLQLDATNLTWGNPKDLRLVGNECINFQSAARSVTFTATDGSKTVTQPEFVGPKYCLFANGCETITATDNYFGDACFSNVLLAPVSGGFIANIKFTTNFFDGCGNDQFHLTTQQTNNLVKDVTITGNNFNQELRGLRHIAIYAFGTTQSATDVVISGNTFTASIGCGMILTGCNGAMIGDNIVTNYNCLGTSPGADAQFISAIYMDNYNARTVAYGNMLGGGDGSFSTVSPPNYCFAGVTILDSLAQGVRGTCFQGGNWNGGVISASNVLTFTPQQMYYNTVPTVDNAFSFGGASARWLAVWAVNGAIQTSDPELKTDMAALPPCLPVVAEINPVTFKWKDGGVDPETGLNRPGKRTHWGFAAPEVKAAMDGIGMDFGGYVLAEDGTECLRPDQLIPVLWKGLQEAVGKIDTLAAEVAALRDARQPTANRSDV